MIIFPPKGYSIEWYLNLFSKRNFVSAAQLSVQVAVIATKAPIDGRSKWTGKLAGMEGEDVLLEVDGIVEHIAITEIKRARLKGSIDFSS